MGKTGSQRWGEGLPRLYDTDPEDEEDCAEPTRVGPIERAVIDAMMRAAEAREATPHRRSALRTPLTGVRLIRAEALAPSEPEAVRGQSDTVPLFEWDASVRPRDTQVDEIEIDCSFDDAGPTATRGDREGDAEIERSLTAHIAWNLRETHLPAIVALAARPLPPVTSCQSRVVPYAGDSDAEIILPPGLMRPRRRLATAVLVFLGLAFGALLVMAYLSGWFEA